MRSTRGEKIFYAVNYGFQILIAFLCLAPILHILAISFSANDAVNSGLVTFWPVKPTLIGYEYLLNNNMFWRSMANSIVRAVLGVAVNVLCSCLVAYPLSKNSHDFKLRSFYAWIFFIPMIVNGGLIPTYMVVVETKLLNSVWSIILPGAVHVFFILVLLNFFRNIPKEMEEAALIDGAGQWRILLRVYIPLSKPALATICVYAILNHWNAWFDGAIYLDSLDKFPLMTYLQTVVVNYNPDKLSPSELEKISRLGSRTLKAAQIFVAALPVMLSYPFFQRYFTKGLTLGGVKG
jgi:putative aldouronate transport system permease protein